MNCPPVSLVQLHKLWQSELRSDEVAAKLGCTRGHLFNLVRKHKLGRRPPRFDAPRKSVHPDPTPQEIEERAAAIRATWTTQERYSRMASAYRVQRVTACVFDDSRDHYNEVCFLD
jgi:hypothetical protein